MIKTICKAVIVGAATTVGSMLVNKAVELYNDPYKKAAFKQRVKRIKNAFSAEVES